MHFEVVYANVVQYYTLRLEASSKAQNHTTGNFLFFYIQHSRERRMIN